MIVVSHLTKVYSTQKAVDNISFHVKKGEIVGFLGPNGAGKTTTMNILTGYLAATAGTAKIAGFDILDEPLEAKKRIGYLPEIPPLYLDMTVEEYLGFMFDLKKVKEKKQSHIDDICKSVKVTNMKDRLIKNLSKGYRQRVGIAQAMLGNPDILILDEPTVGLDPNQILEIRNLIKELGKDHTIILSSHILSEVQAVCERVIIINGGKIVADGRLDELSQKFSDNYDIVVKIKGDEAKIKQSLESVYNVDRVLLGGQKEKGIFEFTLKVKEKSDIRENLFERMSEKKLPIYELRSSQLTLEDIFVGLTTGAITDHSIFNIPNENQEEVEKDNVDKDKGGKTNGSSL